MVFESAFGESINKEKPLFQFFQKTDHAMKYIYLTALVLLLPLAGYNQESSKSRWTLGVETGFNFVTDCLVCSSNQHHNNTLPYAIRAEHRIFRWLSLQFSLGYFKTTHDRLTTTEFGLSLAENASADLSFQLPTATATIGPRLQIRIGQGDLGLEYRSGLLTQTLQVQATELNGRSHGLQHDWTTARAQAWRLSYTYWPTQQLAISVNGENLSAWNLGYPELKGDLNSLLPESPYLHRLFSEPDRYMGLVDYFWMSTLTIGIHYRI